MIQTSIYEMDYENNHGGSINKRLALANTENMQRDLSEFERISANTLLLTHNLKFLRVTNDDMNVIF
jgi:hypothetical protein